MDSIIMFLTVTGLLIVGTFLAWAIIRTLWALAIGAFIYLRWYGW